ncbi:MAG TPA: alpha/beta hydrolase [Pyrinomonadaceae bacterium]|nr:alpha/beta hydrolase [Pyrinomonadaceae bacterium]
MFKRALALCRLVFGALCFSVALLAVFRAPTTSLWMLSIGVTEWGHVLALFSLVALLPGWRRSRAGRVGATLGLLAALLALSPLARAALIARHLPSDLERAFGSAPPRATHDVAPRSAPLSATGLVRGIASPAVKRDTLVYTTRGEQSLSLDLYQPNAPHAPAPCVVVIHGGSWQSGDSEQLAPLNDYLAARGYAVAALNYRLGASHPFPAARDDVQAAVSFLKTNAARLGIDAGRFVLLGRSAGGQLALLVGYTAGDPAIRGVVSYYAPADMRYGFAHPANPLVYDSRGVLASHLGGTPDDAPAQYDAASPINFVGADTPPTLLIHGGRDELVSPAQSERLAARLAGASRPHLLLRLPWATHACDFNFGGPCGQISTYAVERFLASVTR